VNNLLAAAANNNNSKVDNYLCFFLHGFFFLNNINSGFLYFLFVENLKKILKLRQFDHLLLAGVIIF
jgi:hypothetical protein